MRLILAFLCLLASPAWACPLPPHGAALAGEFLRETNAVRSKAHLPALRPDARLARAAQAHACDNARHGTYAHRGSDGSTLAQRLSRAGYPYRRAAENTGWGFRSAASALHWWMGSPPHRANLLNPRLKEIGIGLASGTDRKLYWVLDLGGR